MEHLVISPNYARLLKSYGVRCISEFSYLCHIEHDENELLLYKTEDISPINDSSSLLPALTINELVAILDAAKTEVTIMASDLGGGVRIIMKGAIEESVKGFRAGRSNMDIQADCIVKLIKKGIINQDIINSILQRRNLHKENVNKIEAAIKAMNDVLDELRLLLSDVK